MNAAPQGLDPETVTLTEAPTATDAALARTAVTVPRVAWPGTVTTDRPLNRRAVIHLIWMTEANSTPQACSGRGRRALASISRWVRKILHQSLCSATGIPHST